MKRNQGFTLIELIIVIVILGILAVTAAPKFLNFSGDAKASTLTAVKGSLEAAASLIYGKSLIAGVQSAPTSTADGIAVAYGYPQATTAVINSIADFPSDQWSVVEAAADTHGAVEGDDVVIYSFGTTVGSAAGTACHVVYKASTAPETKPVITVYKEGC